MNNIYFNSSTRSYPKFIPERNELERLMSHTDGPSESLKHKERTIREIHTQQAEVMDAWTLVLEDRES